MVVTFALFAAAGVHAEWKTDGSPLAPALGAVVCSDGRGGLYGSVGYPIRFARLFRLTSRGEAASGWPPTGLELTPNMSQSEHNTTEPVSALPDGEGGLYLLTAEQAPFNGHGGFLYPVQFYVHRRTATGQVARGWTEAGVRLDSIWIDHNHEVRHLPSMVPDGRRGVLVAWLGEGGSQKPVFVQRVTADGSVAWGDVGIRVRSLPGACTLPALADDGRGGALVFWGQWDSTGTRIRVHGQHVLMSGAVAWEPEGRELTRGSFDRVVSAIPADGGWIRAFYRTAIAATPDGEGGALLFWAGAQGADLDVFATRVAPAGWLPWGREVRVCSAPGEQSSVVSATWRAGGAVVAWRDGRAGGDVGIYAQAVSRAGRAMWASDGVAIATGAGERGPVVIEPAGQRSVYFAWADPRLGGQIFAQQLLGDDRRSPGWPENGLLVSRTAEPDNGGSVALQLIEGARGGVIASWSSYRIGSLAMSITPFGPASSQLATRTRDFALEPVEEPGDERMPAFALHVAIPNPVTDDAVVRFSLSDSAPATLELMDLAGRRVWSKNVGELGAGEHVVRLAEGARMSRGVYFLRLTQGARFATTRAVLLR
jgi:hypothetical protein